MSTKLENLCAIQQKMMNSSCYIQKVKGHPRWDVTLQKHLLNTIRSGGQTVEIHSAAG